MIYLDYSATTNVDKEVLKAFNKACFDYVGNANSKHRLGLESNKRIEECSKNILNSLDCKNKTIIYTSGASESNNLAIKGVASIYKNYGNHIITTELEHSSIIAPLNYLQKNGYKVDFVNIKEDGTVDLEHLKSLITEETILVSINSVNSELGIHQPINEIGKLLKNYNHILFHVDITQSIGKVKENFDNIDLFSIGAHKFYGLKGIGALIINNNIKLEPLIHGGKSTTVFRSGTPTLPLIVSLEKAVSIIDYNNFNKVLELNKYLKNKLSNISNVYINSNDKSIPHILNISITNKDQDEVLNYMSDNNIFISTMSACSSEKKLSGAVFKITKDEKRALSSIRISISHLTTKKELNILVKKIKEVSK